MRRLSALICLLVVAAAGSAWAHGGDSHETGEPHIVTPKALQCSAYSDQADAQREHDRVTDPGSAQPVLGALDPDGDGVACEDLPNAPEDENLLPGAPRGGVAVGAGGLSRPWTGLPSWWLR